MDLMAVINKAIEDQINRVVDDRVRQLEAKLDNYRRLLYEVEPAPVQTPKEESTFTSFEKRVRHCILNATQFKGDNGFIRGDVINLVSADLHTDTLKTGQKQVITHVLSALCKEGKIRSNGKKTKATRYHFQREGGAAELLPTGGSVESSVASICPTPQIREQCQSEEQEGSHIQPVLEPGEVG